MFGIAVFWGVVVICATSLDVEIELKEIRTILARQEREIQELKGENRVLRNENRVLQADMRRMATEIENLKTDNFLRTAIVPQFPVSQNEGLKEKNENGFLKSRSIDTQAMKLSKMKHPGTTRLTSDSVAFYANMGSYEHNPSIHHAIIFNRVQTNVGDGYKGYSGVFTAPSSGVYFFTWTIYSGGNGETKLQIFINDRILGNTYSDTRTTGSFDSDSGSMVVHLNAHDNVFIRAGRDCTTSIISNSYYGISTFAGWKLF